MLQFSPTSSMTDLWSMRSIAFRTVLDLPAEAFCGAGRTQLERRNRCTGPFSMGTRSAKTLYICPSDVVAPEENNLLTIVQSRLWQSGWIAT